VPVATSLYVTDDIAQLSDVFPLFGDASKTASDEAVVVVEKPGDVIAAVLHPSIVLATAQVTMEGPALSILVLYTVDDELPHASVSVTVTTALQVPVVPTVSVTALQLSVAVLQLLQLPVLLRLMDNMQLLFQECSQVE